MRRRRSRSESANDRADSSHIADAREYGAERYKASFLRRAALVALCVKLAIALLAFDPLALNSFAQPKIVLGHSFDLLLLALLAALALEHRREMFRWSPMHIPIAVLVLVYAAATVGAMDHRVAVFGTSDRGLGLLALLDGALVYVVAAAVVRARSDLLTVAMALACAAAFVLGYEAIQWLGLDPFVWSRPSSEALFSTLGNRGVLAQFLGVVTVASAAVAVARDMEPRARAVAGGLAACALAGTLLSGGRASVIGLIAGGAVVALVLVVWEPDRRRRVRLGLGGLALGAAILGGIALSPIGARFGSLLTNPGPALAAGPDGGDLSVEARLDLYRVAAEIVQARPLLGVGPDNYAVAFAGRRTLDSNRLYESAAPQSSPHSWVAKLATDAGLLGLVSFMTAVVLALYIAATGPPDPWRLAAAGAIGAYLGTGLVSVNHVATDWLPWFAFGALAAPVVGSRSGSTANPGRAERPRATRRATNLLSNRTLGLLGVGLVLALLTPRDPLEAGRYAQVARAARGGDERMQAAGIRAGERAVALDGGRSDYWDQLALLYYQVGDMREAARAWNRAATIAPYHSFYIANLAVAQTRLGLQGDASSLREGLATARRAVALDRNVPEAQYALAIAAAANGRSEETIEAAEHWLRLVGRPDSVMSDTAAAAYLARGNASDAERWIRLVVTGDDVGPSRLRMVLARALVAQNRVSEAVRQLDLILATNPTDQAALQLKAELTRR